MRELKNYEVWEQIFNSDIYWNEKSTKPYRCEKVYRCKKCGCEKRYVIE